MSLLCCGATVTVWAIADESRREGGVPGRTCELTGACPLRVGVADGGRDGGHVAGAPVAEGETGNPAVAGAS